ncbi:bifunctional metallophosphatase/5'-nucleotidase [Salininema proteolyticum]|uniref:Bifunctional metallophosphatase/5'-nucleotidase n=1 Tax=Salininema proteolyticum TaxID=1607685 RepID=A0ABV8TZ84_9ACTN
MSVKRRSLLGASAAGAAAAISSPASARPVKRYSFTAMGTTDLHGHVFNWDYFADGEYADDEGNAKGLSRIATLVERVREEKGRENTVLIDAGDTIQGTPLAYYFAKVDPIAEPGGPTHPMAQAMNEIGYDAAALGNHEFNYGLDTLRAFESQLEFPLLGANAIDLDSGEPAFPPYHFVRLKPPHGKPVQVAILGLTNPGIAIWDKAHVEGVMEFPGLESQAAHWVPRLRKMGADVVIVSAHSGTSGESAYDPEQIPHVENASQLVAERVPGIDAVLVGHAHEEIPERVVFNEETGAPVVLSEPLFHAQRLTLFDIDLEFSRGRWHVADVRASLLDSAEAEDHPRIAEILTAEHTDVVGYVNQVVGRNGIELRTEEARYKDEPVIDLIAHVQAEVVAEALAGTEHSGLPVLSQASPFSRTAVIPAGDVTIRALSGLYVYDNTLSAKKLTGAQVRDYLEYSAEYFVRTAPGGEVDPDAVTNAGGRPDYNFDYVSGLTYDIDISRPAGSRVVGLSFDGAPLEDGMEFVLAVNNYRANGGGAFPHVADAEELWSESTEIRTRIIEWVQERGEIDPAEFASVDWRLTREGEPVFE